MKICIKQCQNPLIYILVTNALNDVFDATGDEPAPKGPVGVQHYLWIVVQYYLRIVVIQRLARCPICELEVVSSQMQIEIRSKPSVEILAYTNMDSSWKLASKKSCSLKVSVHPWRCHGLHMLRLYQCVQTSINLCCRGEQYFNNITSIFNCYRCPEMISR